MLQVGEMAPDFRLDAGTGETIESSKLRGSPFVLYFYPKDHTSGCTLETREFGSVQSQFESRGVRVFGCSVGDVAAKTDFARECDAASLPLLADPDHAVAEAYGAWRLSKFRGQEYMGVARTTFLVGADGTVLQVWESVKPEGHAQAVLEEVDRRLRPAS